MLTVNTPITLSHSVPEFGCQLSSLDNALARLLTRSRTSTAEYSMPVRPQVKGGLDFCIGYRPCFSSNMNSWMGTVFGGSRSLGTHEGEVKTIVLDLPCLSKAPVWCASHEEMDWLWVTAPVLGGSTRFHSAFFLLCTNDDQHVRDPGLSCLYSSCAMTASSIRDLLCGEAQATKGNECGGDITEVPPDLPHAYYSVVPRGSSATLFCQSDFEQGRTRS